MSEFEFPDRNPRIMFEPEVREVTGLSSECIRTEEERGNFPPRRMVSKGRRGWVNLEIYDHILGLPTAREDR